MNNAPYDDVSEKEEREFWVKLGLESLARAYADDEPEYPLSSIIEFNPDYVPLSQAERDELKKT